MTEQECCIILNMLNGIGPARAASLAAAFGSMTAVFQASAEDLAKVHGISELLADHIVHWEKYADLEDELALAEKGGVQILTRLDPDYPAILREIHDAPLCLYLRGHLPPETGVRALALVGTRNISHYGSYMARHLSESAVYSGWATVSGLAVGVDTAVHQATVEAGGHTIAVLGGGLTKLHPMENLDLACRIVQSGGAVISEFPLRMMPSRHTFPMRNRIISGLSQGTVVVEAGLNSGSLITASHALEQGRRLFAVPGQANNSNANGCNALIRQGAVLVENFEHILEEFDFLPGFGSAFGENETVSQPDADSLFAEQAELALSETDQQILDYLQKNGTSSIETISNGTEIPASDLISSMISLEILRKVKKNPDGSYSRLR